MEWFHDRAKGDRGQDCKSETYFDVISINNGLLQQFDTPPHPKDRPTNLFIGAFMGEAPMNLFAATVKRSSDRIGLVLDRQHCIDYAIDDFPVRHEPSLPAGRELVVGIRPRALKRTGRGIAVTVTDNQWLGDQTHIVGRFGDCSLVMMVHGLCDYAKGEQNHVGMAARHLHLFDKESGGNLTASPG